MNNLSSDESGKSNGSDKIFKNGQLKGKRVKVPFDLLSCGTCSCLSSGGRKADKKSDYITSCASSSYYMLNHINNSKKSEFIMILKKEA